ncbi:hypothetical protein IFM89_030543, partial [Coptis chinensis]
RHCGQAVGARQINMLGIHMQRSWIITGVTALVLTPTYILTTPILKLFHQSANVSELAGRYSIWVIPQLFAYALNFPMHKFLQSHSKVWAITVICLVALLFHILLNWVLVIKFGHGLVGDAIAGNISWAFVVVAQMLYVVFGCFPDSWTGFSMLAFNSLVGFVKLSLSSAVMLCLDIWYATALILMVGHLKHPEIAVDAISTCLNSQVWALNIATGFSAAARCSSRCRLAIMGCFCEHRVYYLFGLPISILLGYKFEFGVQGIWSGILGGCLLQTVMLLFITIRTNWQKEALQAELRVKTWGGPSKSLNLQKTCHNAHLGVDEAYLSVHLCKFT